MNFPPTETESLISALRDELQDRGALLHLLETQHRTPPGDKATAAHELSVAIQQRRSDVVRSRERRQEEFRSLVKDGAADPAVGEKAISLHSLLPHFPLTVAPMIEALVDEVNHLIVRVESFSSDE